MVVILKKKRKNVILKNAAVLCTANSPFRTLVVYTLSIGFYYNFMLINKFERKKKPQLEQTHKVSLFCPEVCNRSAAYKVFNI